MKKIFFIAFGLALTSAGFAQTNKFVTLKGDIANKNGDMIYIREGRTVLKKIPLTAEGVFKDTLKVKEGLYQMFDGMEYTEMYLKNGYDLKMKLDAKKFDETIAYEGAGAAENNFLAKSTVLNHEFEGKIDNLISAGEAAFKKELDAKTAADTKRLNEKKLDPNFVALETKAIAEYSVEVQKYYAQKLALKNLNNTVPPTFTFDNYKGGNTKFEDFKGKYVYIDVWATWCGPCRGEIPYLQTLEEKYHGKNIAFVSVSFDKDIEKWKTMIKTKEMGGEQLIASLESHKAMSDFFKISTIPRFILLDPSGKIINSDAPKPSNSETVSMLDSLLK